MDRKEFHKQWNLLKNTWFGNFYIGTAAKKEHKGNASLEVSLH